MLLATPEGLRLGVRLRAPRTDLHIPALCDVEVGSVIRRLLIQRSIDEARAFEALADHADLPVTRHGHLALLERAMALRSNFSFYDAIYVSLAEAIGATLVTADRRLSSAALAHASVAVDLIA